MNAIQKLLSGEENAHWINQYNKDLKNYPQGMLSREAYSWADADSENKTLYYTPTVEELLIAIIHNKDIYTNDECELRFTYGESVENKLMKFLQMNDNVGDDYFINNQLYKLKVPKYNYDLGKGIHVRTPYPTKEELDKAELENPGYSAHSRYGAIQLIEKHGK